MFKISVCIPAYNRPEDFSALLKTVVEQDYDNYEIVVSEDCSPMAAEIEEVTQGFIKQYPHIAINYSSNSENLGFDGNLRALLSKATGEYCLYMGNDDLMCPGALRKVAEILTQYENVGVLMRSYSSFEGSPENIVQTFQYFDSNRFFPAGRETIITFFRRSVVIPGVTVHREKALAYNTDRFDGTLLYQLYLVANLLTDMNGVYLSDIIVKYRNGGTPFFGNSEREKGRYIPLQITPQHSLNFMQGMFDIAKFVEETRQVKIYNAIIKDIGNYSYPILAIQSKNKISYIRYAFQLARMGLWKNGMFFIYFWMLLFLRSNWIDAVIVRIKGYWGHTPVLGSVYKGEKAF